MLAEKAIFYYNNGLNCSQCLIKAYGDVYNIEIHSQLLNAAEVINNGFGIGNMCSAAVAAVIILSLHFNDEKAKAKRIIFLDRFHSKFKDFNCIKLKNTGCETIITEVCSILKDLL